MNGYESLKEVERRAYRSTLQDGFHELLCGGIFLVFTLISILESVGISRFYCYPSILVLAVIPWLGKRFVTQPRLGAVEFGAKRKAMRRTTALIGVIAVVIMAPLLTIILAKEPPGGMNWRLFALIAAPAIAIGVSLINYSRMYVYAALFLFGIAASEFLLSYVHRTVGNIVVFGIPGILITGYGFYLLVNFLKTHPRPTAEEYHVQQ